MPLSVASVVFPDPLPSLPFKVTCIRSAERSGLIRDRVYDVRIVVRDGVSHRGTGAKGYVVSDEETGETLPNIWHPNRFRTA